MANLSENTLFPILPPNPGNTPTGLARLAAEATHVADGHNITFRALGTRSLLNKSVSRRQLSLAYSINPYRGCEFACRYCYARYTHEFLQPATTPDTRERNPRLANRLRTRNLPQGKRRLAPRAGTQTYRSSRGNRPRHRHRPLPAHRAHRQDHRDRSSKSSPAAPATASASSPSQSSSSATSISCSKSPPETPLSSTSPSPPRTPNSPGCSNPAPPAPTSVSRPSASFATPASPPASSARRSCPVLPTTPAPSTAWQPAPPTHAPPSSPPSRSSSSRAHVQLS